MEDIVPDKLSARMSRSGRESEGYSSFEGPLKKVKHFTSGWRQWQKGRLCQTRIGFAWILAIILKTHRRIFDNKVTNMFGITSGCLVIIEFIHSFIHSGHFYSAPSSPLLLRGAPDY